MNSHIKALCGGVSIAAALIALGVLTVQPAVAGVYAYPLKNQSARQQQDDELACVNWATNRTGFDPRNPPVYRGGYSGGGPSGSVQSGVFGRGSYGQGGGLGDAGKGAGIGLLGGAIAGDAGKGAAIGALSGLFIGGVKRSNQAQERENWERQQAQQQSQQRAQFNAQVGQMRAEHDRAFGACMSARGYRVN
jgi:hypothetical protein